MMMTIDPPLFLNLTMTIMAPVCRAPKTIPSLDVLLNALKIGTIVRTPGDFNAFNFDQAYRSSGGFPVFSLSFRAATGGLRKDPKPSAGVLPAFFANLLPEEKLHEAMEKHHEGNVRPGNDFDLLAALGPDLPEAVCRYIAKFPFTALSGRFRERIRQPGAGSSNWHGGS